MIEFEFRIGGRNTSPSGLAKALADELRKKLKAEIESRLRTVRCPEHGSRPMRLSMTGSTGRVTGICCEKMRDVLAREIGSS